MTEKWKGQTRGGTFGYMFFIYLIRIFGVRPAYFFLYFVVPYFVLFAPKAVGSIWKYSRKILKKGRRGSVIMVFRNFYTLGQILIDKIAINSGKTAPYKFEFENYGEFSKMLAEDRGAVIIGAHAGNWEMGAPFFRDYSRKLNIVMFDNEHRKIKELIESNTIRQDYKIIAVNEDGLGHIFKITEALSRSEYVCFQGDRFTEKEKSTETVFMGEKAEFPAGPFLVASKMGTPVMSYFAMREKGMRYRFHFFVLNGDGTMKLKPEDLLERYVRILEMMLKKYPEQWFNYYNFWSYER